MMSGGVRAGANRPMKFCDIISGSPCSTAVGISGAAARRRGVVTARMRNLPLRCSSMSWAVTLGVAIGICPLSRSVSAGPAPLYGTCTMSPPPISDLNSSPVS